MEQLKYFASAFLCMGFIFLLLVRIFKNTNYIRKSIFMLICGGVIILIFIGGFVYDLFTNAIPYPTGKYDITYFAYLIASFFYTALIFIINFVKGHNRRQRFKIKTNQKQKATPTIKDKKEYIYFIFKLNNNILLSKEFNGNDVFYKSINMKFPYGEFFHDEIVKKYINDNELDVNDYKLIGKATKHEKKDIVYFCYQIDLNSKPKKLEDFEEVSLMVLMNYNLEEIDKKIIFNSIVKKDFDIDL